MPTEYYGSRLSPHLTRTAEGFLICRAVPIARTGEQLYAAAELGLPDSGVVRVMRTEDEVFAPQAIASFEGKPFCDGHPPQDVDAANAPSCVKGAVTRVRRGEGEASDCLVADIIVYDAATVKKILAGRREISCGYRCRYEPDGRGGYCQKEIAGNHVALVEKGRAGARVAIRDEEKSRERMVRMTEKKTFWGRLIGLVRDHQPEDLETAVEEMVRSCEDAPDHAARIKALEDRVTALETASAAARTEKDCPVTTDSLYAALSSAGHEPPEDPRMLGKKWAAAYNPHFRRTT